MSASNYPPSSRPLPGIGIRGNGPDAARHGHHRFMELLDGLQLADCVQAAPGGDGSQHRYCLRPDSFAGLTPDHDTTGLCATLGLDTQDSPRDLEKEILTAMLASPVPFDYPSFDEFESALRVRGNIVQAARRTALAFDTEHAERPEAFWRYAESSGFTLKEGANLIEALRLTTQPDRSKRLYSFSCYRATEYVILLAVAQELQASNPPLFEQLQRQWETRAIMSGQFHEVFLREYGSMDAPLPPMYYVPGDRLWFRNPDGHSSNAEGYEGSWVFYLGNGLFTNFWKRDQPFTVTTKCVELFHWRNATYRDDQGKLQVDDDVVDALVAKSLSDPGEVASIRDRMLRLRDPGGVYGDGGCIDTSRECVRLLRPGTSELVFPEGGGAALARAS
ncbi:hypothetical protein [Parapusillimonas granuli]|nr:hypothetical protein [Parapusillimonas granuli]MBB5216252.1 hypothetical protein [Parapusillimonas granuli]MEB2400526.1 hypothetical protein [Alcaligenaceae bacterium]